MEGHSKGGEFVVAQGGMTSIKQKQLRLDISLE